MRQTSSGPLDWLLAWAFPHSSRFERYGLLALLIGLEFFLIISPGAGFDFTYYYLPALSGEKLFYYPYWVKWFLEAIRWLSFPFNYRIWNLIVPILLVIGLRMGKGSPWKLFLSLPFIWVMWYGQIESFVAFGIILAWWAYKNEKYLLLGVGFALASFKPHLSGPLALLILVWLPTWRARAIAFWLLAPLVVLSLVVFGPGWPVEWLQTISSPIFTESYNNSSLYPYVGYLAMLLWLPAIFIALEKEKRALVFLATTLLTMPYVPPYNQLVLYFFPMSWIQWLLGQTFWLTAYNEAFFGLNFLLPLSILIQIYFGKAQRWKNPG